MSPVLLSWLAAFAVNGLLCIALKDRAAILARRCLLVLTSAFVVFTIGLAASKQSGNPAKNEPVMENDRAELTLRFETAMSVIDSSMSKIAGGALPVKRRDFHSEAAKLLEDTLNREPESWKTEAKLGIVLADQGGTSQRAKALTIFRQLSKRRDPNASQTGKVLGQIYSAEHISQSQAAQYAAVITKDVPSGWFANAAMLRLYKASGNATAYNNLRLQIEDRAARLLLNVGLVVAVGVVAGLIGCLTILISLFTMPRKLGNPQDEDGGATAVPWGWLTIYTVFIAWLATQVLLGQFAQTFVKGKGLLTGSALISGISTAVLYFISNGPGLFYIYWFACRPFGLSFTRTVRLVAHSGKLGPARLASIGFLAWCSAIPVVVAAYMIASKYLGSQGSSNPIIALVLDAARSSDYLAIAVFYLTLGVLAPLCEETLFRGFLYRSLRKRLGVGTSLFVSASVFAAVHLDSGAVVPLLCLGWIFAYVYERTRSLLPSMVAHGLWNSGTFSLMLLIFGQ